MDDLHTTLDREAWLAGRRAGWGCSDLGALWILLGWVSDEDLESYETVNGHKVYTTPRYMVEAAAVMKRSGLPRIIAEKVGKAKPRHQSDAMSEGKAKEALLFRHAGLWQSPEAHYAPEVKVWPAEWESRLVGRDPWVMADAEEPRLLCTVEAWHGRTAWELKTDRAGNKTEPTWYWRLQAKAQAVVLGLDHWGVVYGPGWAMTDSPAFPDLADPIEFGPYPVTEADRTMIRTAVRMGWRMVEAAQTTEHPVTLSPQVLRESEG